MRILIGAAALLLAAACNPAAQDSTDTADMQATTTEPAAPTTTTSIVMTEQDARSRIESAGYTNVTGLMQNPDGTWTATGTMDGQTTTVTVTESGVQATTAPAPTP